MFKGTLEAKKIFEENIERPILYYFDPDVDGLISGYLFCYYLEAMGLEYSFHINDNRKHGFLLEPELLRGYMVICSDFSIDENILRKLEELDIVVICIDHHEISGELRLWDKGVVINNQYYFEEESKRYLSGAGVVFEVLRDWNSNFDTRENRALVGITLLSDVRPIENLEAREYLNCTYSMDNSEGYFKYLIDNTIKNNFGFGAPKMDRNFIDFTFSPRINSMLRFNESFEAVEFILGHGMHTEDKRELQKAYAEFLIKKASILELTHINVVTIQKSELKDFWEYLAINGKCIGENNQPMWNEFSLIDIEPANFIGLACSRIKDTGKDTVIALLENDRLLRGSFRGKFDGIDYLDIFRKYDSIAFGHKGAFGIHEIDLREGTVEKLNNNIGFVEKDYKPTATVLQVENLSMFYLNRARKIAEKNNFVRDAYRTYVKYNGDNIIRTMGGEKYVEYMVDGYRVKCFDSELGVKEGLILPITEKGYVNLYLKDLTL